MMKSANYRVGGRGLALAAFMVLAAAAPSSARAAESGGSVHLLHEWLGTQCSFVPDLDVGDCCAKHDVAYEEGGNEWDRLAADRQFRDCIRSHNRPVVAKIYYAGVRLFGWAFFNYH